jgi:hypothetical protein
MTERDGLIASYYTLTGTPVGQPPRFSFADGVSAAGRAGFTGIGLLFDDYAALRSSGQSDADLLGDGSRPRTAAWRADDGWPCHPGGATRRDESLASSAVEPWEIAARLEIDDLIARYARYADSGRSRDLAALFTDDGVLASGEDELHGRVAIAGYLDANQASLAGRDPAGRIRHHVSSCRIDLTSRSSASATCYFLAITGIGPDHWGIYRDQLVHDGAEWRFARRAAVVEGSAPGSWAAARHA